MNDIEKRARELLASRYAGYPAEQRRIREGQLTHYESIHYIPAIIAALTPPEGYELIPVAEAERLRELAWRYKELQK